MEAYRTPIKANRYWSRPKPKVYACNLRDAERMYKSNYKEYLAEKDFRLQSSYSLDTTDRFAHLRAGPIRRREASAQPFSTRHSDVSSTSEAILSRASEAPEATNSKPIPVYDPLKETQSLEERLNRLKKLREELGLPLDSESSTKTLHDSQSRSFATDNDSSYSSERTSRLRSRTAAAAANSDESAYSSRSERSSRMNGIGSSSSDDYKLKSERSPAELKLTPRLERKRESNREEFNITPKLDRKPLSTKDDVSDDYSFSSKSEKKTDRFSKLSTTTASSSSPSRTRKAAASAETLDLGDEDDDSVIKMMKKLPSSQQILERISKMDLDD